MPTLNPTQHPLGPPTVSGDAITVDQMLRQPTRITRMISDLTLQRFIADRLFSSPGGVSGGALIYDEVQANDLYTTRPIERVAPGTEFPIVTTERRQPKVATVEKWGGKGFVTFEARDRNESSVFTNEVRRVANTVVKQINARTVEAVEAAIAANAALSIPVPGGVAWASAVPNGNSPTIPANTPLAAVALAQATADTEEMGMVYDTLLVNPMNALALRNFYGPGLSAALADVGIDEMYASMRVTLGTAYVAAAKQVGEMRMEQPLRTATWTEELTEREWFQTSVRPLFAVTNPYAIRKLTGVS